MTKHIKPFAIAAVFLVGCAVGGASARFVVPPANAQQQATVAKWEHFCFAADGKRDLVSKANVAGSQGWEMVGSGMESGDTTWCFKRPAIGGYPPPPAQ
jgi:hypothetical protein